MFACLFVLALLVTLFWGLSLPDFHSDTALLCVCLSLSSALIGKEIAGVRARPVHFILLVYLCTFYLLPGIFHSSINSYPFYGMSYPASARLGASLIVLIFVGFYAFGYYLRPQRPVANTVRAPDGSSALATASIGLAGLSLLCGMAFGLDRLNALRDATSHFENLTPIDLVLQNAARSAGFLGVVTAAIAWRRSPGIASLLRSLIPLVALLATNNLFSMPRYVAGAYAIIVFLVLVDFRRIWKLLTLGGLLLAQVTLFPLLNAVTRGEGIAGFRLDPLSYIATHGDFDGMQSTINTFVMVDELGPQWGRQLLSALLFFVPRTMFESKSRGTGYDAAEYAGYDFLNISAPMPAELFVDFSFVGLMVLSLALGLAVRWVDDAYERGIAQSSEISKLLPAIVAGFTVILMRGSLVGVLPPVVVMLSLAWLTQALLKRLSANRRSTAREPAR